MNEQPNPYYEDFKDTLIELKKLKAALRILLTGIEKDIKIQDEMMQKYGLDEEETKFELETLTKYQKIMKNLLEEK